MQDNNKKDYGRLTLTLRHGDSVIVGDTLLTVVQLKNKQLRLQFNAPKEIRILRTNSIDNKNR